jgi:hypothetical protein
MKHTKINYQSLAPLAILTLAMAFCFAGCGSAEDEKPPTDPAYYKGEMKGKGGQMGAVE